MKSSLLTLILFGFALTSAAQHTHGKPAPVPELERFHKVIAVIWHEAWPKEDTERLISLAPSVAMGVDSIAHAKLPESMKEKKEAWEKGVNELQKAAEEYGKAAKAKEKAALLKAAEVLHQKYEGLAELL